MQFSRNSRQLREVSACVASEDVSSSESYWTLSVSGLLQPRNESTSFSQLAPCFYHEWINLRILARVNEDAVLSDSSHSGGAAADAVVPVCPSSGLGPLRFRSSCAVVFGDPPGSFMVVGPRVARARQLAWAGVSPARLIVRLFRCQLGSRLSPFLGSEWTLNLSVFQQLGVGGRCQSTFATSLFHRCLPYFSLFHDPNALRTEVLQPWNGWQAYAFPPYALLYAIL